MGNFVLFRGVPAGSRLELSADLPAAAKLSLIGELEDDGGLIHTQWTRQDLAPGPARHVVGASCGAVLTAQFQGNSAETVTVTVRLLDAQGRPIRPARSLTLNGRRPQVVRAYIDVVC